MSKALPTPVLPESDADGNYPAISYARASLARKIILCREAVGMRQAVFARAASMNVATLCRIESGKVTPALKSIERIDRALRRLEKNAKK